MTQSCCWISSTSERISKVFMSQAFNQDPYLFSDPRCHDIITSYSFFPPSRLLLLRILHPNSFPSWTFSYSGTIGNTILCPSYKDPPKMSSFAHFKLLTHLLRNQDRRCFHSATLVSLRLGWGERGRLQTGSDYWVSWENYGGYCLLPQSLHSVTGVKMCSRALLGE